MCVRTHVEGEEANGCATHRSNSNSSHNSSHDYDPRLRAGAGGRSRQWGRQRARMKEVKLFYEHSHIGSFLATSLVAAFIVLGSREVGG